MTEMTDTQLQIFQEIAAERERQDFQWGGEGHDDTHDERDWLLYIRKQMARAWRAAPFTGVLMTDYRSRLVKIAALAVAALESFDRRCEEERLIRRVLTDVEAELDRTDELVRQQLEASASQRL